MTQTIDWRAQRRAGMAAIAVGFAGAVVLGAATYWWMPLLHGIETIGGRMLLTLKCVIVATLFCLVAGVEAVAHERLQSPAFDPLQGYDDKRLRVNLRYLQNTLEQLPVFAIAVFGLAAYADGEATMRFVVAASVVWIAARFAFWIGYHRSVAMRGLGAPGMALSLGILIYLAWRVGGDIAGTTGAAVLVAAFLATEAVLFRTTRGRDRA